MLVDFEMRTQRTEDCQADCIHKTILLTRYLLQIFFAVSSIEGEAIVTEMKLFYQTVDTYDETGLQVYEGSLFVGVSFRGIEARIFVCNRQHFQL